MLELNFDFCPRFPKKWVKNWRLSSFRIHGWIFSVSHEQTLISGDFMQVRIATDLQSSKNRGHPSRNCDSSCCHYRLLSYTGSTWLYDCVPSGRGSSYARQSYSGLYALDVRHYMVSQNFIRAVIWMPIHYLLLIHPFNRLELSLGTSIACSVLY